MLRTGHQVGEALVPVMVGVVVDTSLATGSLRALVLGLAGLAAVFVLLSLCFRFGARATNEALQLAAHDVRMRVVVRLLDPGGGAETGRTSGALFVLTTADAERVGRLLRALVGVAAASGAVVVAAVGLLRISSTLGLLVLVGTPLLLWLGARVSRPLERRSGAEQERAGAATGLAADLVDGLRVLRGVRAEAPAAARYRATSRASLAATLRAARAEAVLGGATSLLTGLFLAVVVYVGGRLALSGAISVGDLVAAVGLTAFLTGPVQILTAVGAMAAQARGSAGRIASVLGTPAAMVGGSAVATGPGAIRWSSVRLPGHDESVDLDVAPGEHVGVVVANPSTAAALARVLGRQQDPLSGTASLDGVPVADLDLRSARAAVHLLGHGSRLFGGSLRDTTGDAGPALVAANVDLPGDLEIGEHGSALSGGQRQRVALARALAADATVLVAHDPTTALDPVTEATVADGIRQLRAGRTTVLVTTSPLLLASCDRVVHLRDGAPPRDGTHESLLAHDDYRELVTA